LLATVIMMIDMKMTAQFADLAWDMKCLLAVVEAAIAKTISTVARLIQIVQGSVQSRQPLAELGTRNDPHLDWIAHHFLPKVTSRRAHLHLPRSQQGLHHIPQDAQDRDLHPIQHGQGLRPQAFLVDQLHYLGHRLHHICQVSETQALLSGLGALSLADPHLLLVLQSTGKVEVGYLKDSHLLWNHWQHKKPCRISRTMILTMSVKMSSMMKTGEEWISSALRGQRPSDLVL